MLHICRSKCPIKSQYFLHGQALDTVDSAKYLGVTFSSDLSWNNHINNLTASANRTLGFIKRNITTKNQQVTRDLAYTSRVRPQAEYASSVWCPYTKSNIDSIEMVQRRAARWVTGNYSHYDSVTEMLKNLGWRSLEQRRYDARLLMFCKIVNGHVAIQLPGYFEHPSRYTRHMHSLSFRQIHTSANYYQFSFYPMSIVLWNRLPQHVPVLSDLDSFKLGVTKINHAYP